MKKKNNLFLKIIFALFIVFLGLYIASVSGYYEKSLSRKVALTDEALKSFEQDVMLGKEVDIINYLNNDIVDYSNVFTKSADKLTDTVEKLLTNGFKSIWDVIKVLFFM